MLPLSSAECNVLCTYTLFGTLKYNVEIPEWIWIWTPGQTFFQGPSPTIFFFFLARYFLFLNYNIHDIFSILRDRPFDFLGVGGGLLGFPSGRSSFFFFSNRKQGYLFSQCEIQIFFFKQKARTFVFTV